LVEAPAITKHAEHINAEGDNNEQEVNDVAGFEEVGLAVIIPNRSGTTNSK